MQTAKRIANDRFTICVYAGKGVFKKEDLSGGVTMKRRNVVYALGLSMALAAGMGFAGNAEEAQQDEYLSQIQGSYVELFPELSKDENRAT